MNFVYDPKIAAQIVAYIQYVSPVKGVKEELQKIDPKLAANPLISPPQSMLDQMKIYDDKALNNEAYVQKWETLTGS
jgi:spermidine/putrescine transport system substrate-binding protein